MKCEHLFFVYSPVHWVHASAIIYKNNLNNIWIFGPKYLQGNFELTSKELDVPIKYLVTGELTSNVCKPLKILFLLHLAIRLPFGSQPEIWTANINAKFNLITHYLLRSFRLNVIDEGALELVQARGQLGGVRGIRKKFPELKVWALRPEKLDLDQLKEVPVESVKKASDTFMAAINTSEFVKQLTDLENCDVLILTSPVSENGNSVYINQEVQIIEQILNLNPSTRFVLKSHYREGPKKYKHLSQKFKNITLNDNANTRHIPIQFFLGKVDKVIGFHSSALFDENLGNNTTVISLSNIVGSKHARIAMSAFPKTINTPSSIEAVGKLLGS